MLDLWIWVLCRALQIFFAVSWREQGALLHMGVRMACAGQLLGLFLIPTPVLGVDSTPRMGEWMVGCDGAIWDDFSSWTCPFPVWDVDRPLSLTYCPPICPV